MDCVNGATTDSNGNGCDLYTWQTASDMCGQFDDEDFDSKTMCCACKFQDFKEKYAYEISGGMEVGYPDDISYLAERLENMPVSNNYIDLSLETSQRLDNGDFLPQKAYFKNVKRMNNGNEFFFGVIDWRPTSLNNAAFSVYRIQMYKGGTDPTKDRNSLRPWVVDYNSDFQKINKRLLPHPRIVNPNRMDHSSEYKFNKWYDSAVAGDEWMHAIYLIFEHPLSTAVIVPVDNDGNPIDKAFSETSSSDAWLVMTNPNPQFPD